MVGLQGSGGECECAHHRTEEGSRFLLLMSTSGHIRVFGMNGIVVETGGDGAHDGRHQGVLVVDFVLCPTYEGSVIATGERR